MLSADRQTVRRHGHLRVMCHVFITDASCDGQSTPACRFHGVFTDMSVFAALTSRKVAAGGSRVSLLTAGHHQFSGWFESEEPSDQLTNLLVHAPQRAGEGQPAVQQRRRDATPAQVTQTSNRFQRVAALSGLRPRPLCPDACERLFKVFSL